MSIKKVNSVADWAKRKTHEVTLPSGAVVQIEIPNLPLLSKTGRIPNHLLASISKLEGKRELTPEDLDEQHEFVNLVVSLTVVSPELAPADVDTLPYEDTEMIVEFALRTRDMDAVAHHIGGLETVESFREARLLG